MKFVQGISARIDALTGAPASSNPAANPASTTAAGLASDSNGSGWPIAGALMAAAFAMGALAVTFLRREVSAK